MRSPLPPFACGATAADAKCQKLSFLVNDYGKDGPTNDAKNLLDKYIVNWTKEKGIKNYTVGKKDVSCELFLNFIVFDEHTCTASAMVCWADGAASRARRRQRRRQSRLRRLCRSRRRPRRRRFPADNVRLIRSKRYLKAIRPFREEGP